MSNRPTSAAQAVMKELRVAGHYPVSAGSDALELKAAKIIDEKLELRGLFASGRLLDRAIQQQHKTRAAVLTQTMLSILQRVSKKSQAMHDERTLESLALVQRMNVGELVDRLVNVSVSFDPKSGDFKKQLEVMIEEHVQKNMPKPAVEHPVANRTIRRVMIEEISKAINGLCDLFGDDLGEDAKRAISVLRAIERMHTDASGHALGNATIDRCTTIEEISKAKDELSDAYVKSPTGLDVGMTTAIVGVVEVLDKLERAYKKPADKHAARVIAFNYEEPE